MLIPVLNVPWGFYLVNVVSNSLRAQLTRRGIATGSAGWAAGMIWNAAGAVGILVRGKPGDALFLVASLAVVVYWVKVARLNRLLAAPVPPATAR